MGAPNKNAAAADDTLGPLNKIISKVINGKKNPTTYWRWATKGIAGPDGTRIRLEIWYTGRQPSTTIAAVHRFIAAVTEARLAHTQRTQNRAPDVTDDDLASVGLTSPK